MHLAVTLPTICSLLCAADAAAETSAGLFEGGRVRLMTVDTRGEELHRLVGPLTWDYHVRNVGPRRKWDGWRAYVVLMSEGIAGVPDGDIVVFIDGGDVMYGGCSEEEFVDRFTTILEVTGAKIIMGAEYNCFDAQRDCRDFPAPHRERVLRAFGLSTKAIDERGSYTVACPGFSNSSCMYLTASCSYPGCSLKYPNAGFYAGYAYNMRNFFIELLRYMDHLEQLWTHGTPTDQAYASLIMTHRLDDIVLDYANVLMDNLFGQRGKPMYDFVFDQNAFFSTTMGKGSIQLGRKVCFFHDNGPGLRDTKSEKLVYLGRLVRQANMSLHSTHS